MSSEALRQEINPFAQVPAPAAEPSPIEPPVGNVVALALPVAEPPASLQQNRQWLSAIELVSEAREAIRLGDERRRELEAELRRTGQKAADEIAQLKAEIHQAQLQVVEARAAEAGAVSRAVEAEMRASNAERRAADAEGWLVRLHKSVVDAFGPLAVSDGSQGARIQ
jgi:hypothetical protein